MSGLFNQASLVLVPSGYKAGKVYSEVPTNGDGDLTFTRASSATRVNSDGLIESPRTNLVLYSEEFDNASWLKTEISITANTITSPDGTLTADTLSIGVDASAVRHRLLQTKTTTIGTTYTGTYYLKANEHQWVQICGVIGYSNGVWANFDLVNGTIGNTGGVDTTASIENVGNGWYRCRVSGVATGTSTTGFEIIVINNTNSGRYPSYQSLVAEDVCYVWGAQLEVGSTATDYIPTTNSVRTTFAGITQDGTSASNIPRLDYSQGSCPALLLEPQRTNLALYSEEFDNAAWTKLNSSITANTTTAPDGTNTADILTDDSVNNVHRLNTATNINVVSGSVYTYSVFLKNNNIDYAILKVFSGSNFAILVNLLSQTVSSTSGSVTSKIEIFGDWIRCSMTFTAASTTATLQIATSDGTMELSGNCTYIGSGESVYIWGAQLEVGAYATSYIKTTSATVTRLADSCSKTGISSLIGQTQGTLFAEIYYQRLTTDFGITALMIINTDGTFQNRIQLSIDQTHKLIAVFTNASAGQNVIASSTNIQEGVHKLALKYTTTECKLFLDGALVQTTALTIFPVATLGVLKIGNNFGNVTPINNGVKIATIYNELLTDTQLAELTTL